MLIFIFGGLKKWGNLLWWGFCTLLLDGFILRLVARKLKTSKKILSKFLISQQEKIDKYETYDDIVQMNRNFYCLYNHAQSSCLFISILEDFVVGTFLLNILINYFCKGKKNSIAYQNSEKSCVSSALFFKDLAQKWAKVTWHI